jgi:methylated-DNA-[protein]-cysteine S-methyltransferase
MSPRTLYITVPSPIGELLLTGNDTHLTGLFLSPRAGTWRIGADWARDDARFADAAEQLRAYFAGERTSFDLPLAPIGTPFQVQVWWALADIPYGQTESYGRLAARVGQPGAARAVGLANGRNPLAIILPCHRVIGASGQLVGYGGGLDRKRWLLAHEAAVRARLSETAPVDRQLRLPDLAGAGPRPVGLGPLSGSPALGQA